MYIPALIAATIMLAVSGCKHHEKLPVVKDPVAVGTSPEPAAPTSPVLTNERSGKKVVPDSVFFFIQRTPCFGTCPSYKLTILKDGSATYEGGRFAEREGNYTGKVDAATMELLVKKAEEYGLFQMQDKYDSNVTDLPSVIIGLNGAGHNKEVLGRHGAPLAFKNLATEVESILSKVVWTPTNPAPER